MSEIPPHREEGSRGSGETNVRSEIGDLQRFHNERYIYTLLINVKFHVLQYVVSTCRKRREICKLEKNSFVINVNSLKKKINIPF